ncbi:hypothetical protein Tco_0553449 [Tanacetum coccineum]
MCGEGIYTYMRWTWTLVTWAFHGPWTSYLCKRSAEKRKDKGKAIMIEDESVQKKSKKQLEQERLSHEEAIRLQEQINEEERKRIARDAKISKQLQE